MRRYAYCKTAGEYVPDSPLNAPLSRVYTRGWHGPKPTTGYGSKLRGRAFDLVERPSFEKVVMGTIMTYACILMLHHLGEPPVISSLVEISSTVFTVIFAVELLLKTMAYGFVKMMKRSPADVYDFTVVCVALIAMFLDLLYGISFNALASTARVTRVLLVFKIMRGAHALQEVCYCAKGF